MKTYDYKRYIKQEGGHYHVIIPQIGIIEKDVSSDVAFKNATDRQNIYIEKMNNLGCEDILPLPLELKKQQSIKELIRTAIIFYLVLFVFILTSAVTASLFFSLAIRQTGDKISTKIERTFKPTPEKKQSRMENFKEKLQTVKPYIDEIKKIIKD